MVTRRRGGGGGVHTCDQQCRSPRADQPVAESVANSQPQKGPVFSTTSSRGRFHCRTSTHRRCQTFAVGTAASLAAIVTRDKVFFGPSNWRSRLSSAWISLRKVGSPTLQTG